MRCSRRNATAWLVALGLAWVPVDAAAEAKSAAPPSQRVGAQDPTIQKKKLRQPTPSGQHALPEVDDEVLIGFEHGDAKRPNAPGKRPSTKPRR